MRESMEKKKSAQETKTIQVTRNITFSSQVKLIINNKKMDKKHKKTGKQPKPGGTKRCI